MPYPLLAMYLEALPEAGAPPGRFPRPAPEIELSEGSHLVYAIQWFSFAFIALAGYGAYYHHRTAKK